MQIINHNLYAYYYSMYLLWLQWIQMFMYFNGPLFKWSMPSASIPNYFDKYNFKEIDKPIEKPNVIKLEKAKIAKTTKSAEEALTTVMSLLIPNLDKDKSFFEQGLTSYDVLKIITRCGENGYIVEMKDVFKYPTYNKLVTKMKRGM